MKSLKKQNKNRRAVAFVLAMISVALLASLSVAMVTMTSANAQMANNHKLGNRALANCRSGLEVVRYVFEGMTVPDSETLTATVTTRLEDLGFTGITATCTETDITFSTAPLDNSKMESFNAKFQFTDPETWNLTVTGTSLTVSRKINADFKFSEGGNSVFDYGVATKGPLLMSGQAGITGLNSDVFIDTLATGNLFTIGSNGVVEGNVYITEEYPEIDVNANATVGDAQGDENVISDVDPVPFPEPDPDYFKKYVDFDDQSSIINKDTDMTVFKVDKTVVLNNIIIEENTDPTFDSDTEINGILYVKQPNNVSFAGKLTVNGIIVAPELTSSTDTSTFDFSGQVKCGDVSNLDQEQFGDLVNETGSFLIAPDSQVTFSGQSNLINGVIACSGIRFTGQAGGDVHGSIINYSSDPMVMDGQGSLRFFESGTEENPAGFKPVIRLSYDNTSYQEVNE